MKFQFTMTTAIGGSETFGPYDSELEANAVRAGTIRFYQQTDRGEDFGRKFSEVEPIK